MSEISKNTLQFLKDLKNNNDRDWFNDNKNIYKEAHEDFTVFVTALIPEITKFDSAVEGLEAKKTIFRIYRDVRFSKDKSPYKTHMGAHIVAGGKKNEHTRAGYYVHIEPGASILAGGAYLPPSSWLKAIRQEIDYESNDLKKILNSSSFKKYFGEMQGEKLKTNPRGYAKDHPEIELLKHKSFLAVHELTDKQLLSKDLLKHSSEVFKALYPFDQFLNRSIE